MKIEEAKARRSAGKTVREFEKRFAAKDDIYFIYDDAVGSVVLTGISLSLHSVEDGYAKVTATVEATRTRHDADLSAADAEAVARSAFDAGRDYLIESDFDAAVMATPAFDTAPVEQDITLLLEFLSNPFTTFKVDVVIGSLYETVAALGFNVWSQHPEDFQFAARAQARLGELRSGADDLAWLL